jgi:hypothetical protein
MKSMNKSNTPSQGGKTSEKIKSITNTNPLRAETWIYQSKIIKTPKTVHKLTIECAKKTSKELKQNMGGAVKLS